MRRTHHGRAEPAVMPAGADARSEAAWQAAVLGNAQFALELYAQLKPTAGNLFFSPYSLSTALAMTYAGARGQTRAQMARALHFHPGQPGSHPALAALEARLAAVAQAGQVELKAANALWPQAGYPFLHQYLTLVEQYYGARIAAVDYRDSEAARQTINAWVEGKTEGRIRNLIPPGILSALTTLVLTNAIYFKGSWARQFDPHRTVAAPFWATPDRPVQVPMMGQQAECRYAEESAAQVLELPYAGNNVSMVLLLPRQVDGLAALERSLTTDLLDGWIGDLQEAEVQAYVPRFELECPFRLDEALQALGMVDAFGAADFSGMDGTTTLSIAAVLHKAFVRVDEAGTEAAAATAVVMDRHLPPTFRADHPFLFLIRDTTTGLILFLGRVMDPGSAGSPA